MVAPDPARSPVRLRLDLGYDGTDFAGWAAQPGRRTVEGLLTDALGLALRLDPPARLVVAGRTDAGVHAAGQVCHADVPARAWEAFGERVRGPAPGELRARLAGLLPADVRVRGVSPAPPGFDARFSATSRRYAYLVCDDPAGVPPLRRRDVLAHRRPLDLAAMTAAARLLVGLHDFAAFCRRRDAPGAPGGVPAATTVRTLLEYRWDRDADGFAVATVVADAFCHSMVRALVGALLPVGDGRRPRSWPAQVLGAGRRDPAVGVVPALGLVLVEVAYPPDGMLAARAREARSVRTPVPAAPHGPVPAAPPGSVPGPPHRPGGRLASGGG